MRPSFSTRMTREEYRDQVRRDLAPFMLNSAALVVEYAARIGASYVMAEDTKEVAREIAKIEGSPLASPGRARVYAATWDGQPRGTMTLAEAKKIAVSTGHSVTLNELGRSPSGGATRGWVNPDGTHRLLGKRRALRG